MVLRGIAVSLAALIAGGIMAEAAHADNHKKPRRIIIDDSYDRGPPIIRDIPGLRIFFGDYALSDEEFDELYGNDRRVYRDDFGDDEPEYVPPRRKVIEREEQPKKPKAAAKPSKPAEQKKAASKTTPTPTPAALSCDKAGAVVSGYGFSSVTPSSCTGKVYAFNATRDGKAFAIKLDPKSGELTEVKKLP